MSVDDGIAGNGRPHPDVASWVALFGLCVAVVVLGDWLFDTSLGLWLLFAVLLTVAAAVTASFREPIPSNLADWLALATFIVVPATLGYFSWRADDEVVRWILRFVIAAVIGSGGGLLVGSGVYEGEGDARPRNTLMQFLHSYRIAADTMAASLGVISAFLIFPTVTISVVNVVLRRIGSNIGRSLTTNGLIEAQWYLYTLLFVTGLAYILRNSINVRVDFWFGNRSSRTQTWIDLVGHTIGLLPFAYIGVKYSWPSVKLSWDAAETSPNAGGLYRPPIKTALMMGFVFLGIQAIAEQIKNIEYLRGHEYRHVSDDPALAGGVHLSVDDFDVDVENRLASGKKR